MKLRSYLASLNTERNHSDLDSVSLNEANDDFSQLWVSDSEEN